MKIGLVISGVETGGGVFQYTQSVIDALITDKSINLYILTDAPEKFSNYANTAKIVISNKRNGKFLKILRLLLLLLNFRIQYGLTKEEEDFLKNIDIVFCPSINPHPIYFSKVKYVFTLHDLQEKYYPKFFNLRERFIRYVVNRALIKNATKILCESKFVKNDILKFYNFSHEKIGIIPSPPPKKFLDSIVSDQDIHNFKNKYGISGDYIYYPAQFWYHKNHLNLLRAFKEIVLNSHYANIQLVFTGSQQNNYLNVKNEVEKLNLQKNVKFLGFLDYQELPIIYKGSIFLMMPSLFESISIPIFEAFSMKTCVCSSNVVALPEQVGEAGILFDPNNIEDMKEKMILLLENKQLREDLANKGYNKIKNFDYLKYQNQLREFLKC